MEFVYYIATVSIVSVACLFIVTPKLFWGYGIRFKVIFSVCFLLFLVSYIPVDNPIMANFIVGQKVPLLSLVVLKINLFVFVKHTGRYPMNTYWVFESKPWKDVVFNIVTFTLLCGVSILVLYLHDQGMW